MKNGLTFLCLLALIVTRIDSFSFAETFSKDVQQEVSQRMQSNNIKKSPDKENESRFAGRKYRYPSMMVKEDMYHSIKIDGNRVDPLLLSLFMKHWEIVSDKYSRDCLYLSPVMTLQELQDTLNFHDEDLKPINDSKPEGPHAKVVTDWLICEVNYLENQFKQNDKSIKVKSVVIDVELQKNAEAHAEYDKKRGFLGRIVDMFADKAHVK